MNPGQQQFFDFIVGFAKPDKVEEVKKLLEECFQRQNDGTFNNEFLNEVTPKIIDALEDDKKAEVKAIMDQFGSQHVSK
ncbi:hypothetical protein [Breznakia pachnodae]|uniref:Uncharacterized protein n=1 Tax=Breznakia pachnodae TaxID=265178 RepID=A0ABU0E718_9FIRM|nr:hypothetical protein [Breznakia pachnodae]MDQ0362703.1 hypothetical protein [Breznakia pachnodae]